MPDKASTESNMAYMGKGLEGWVLKLESCNLRFLESSLRPFKWHLATWTLSTEKASTGSNKSNMGKDLQPWV